MDREQEGKGCGTGHVARYQQIAILAAIHSRPNADTHLPDAAFFARDNQVGHTAQICGDGDARFGVESAGKAAFKDALKA